MLECDRPCRLLLETVQLLKEDPRDLPTIYMETGIPYNWLRSLLYNKPKQPSINRVMFLRENLLTRREKDKCFKTFR